MKNSPFTRIENTIDAQVQIAPGPIWRWKMKSSSLGDHNRRHFLRALGSTFAAAGAVVAAPIPEAKAYDPGREETRKRYRETEDVRAFYRTNRYEGVKK
jgi:hypothetical protein